MREERRTKLIAAAITVIVAATPIASAQAAGSKSHRGTLRIFTSETEGSSSQPYTSETIRVRQLGKKGKRVRVFKRERGGHLALRLAPGHYEITCFSERRAVVIHAGKTTVVRFLLENNLSYFH
jgi:hypothetical protein